MGGGGGRSYQPDLHVIKETSLYDGTGASCLLGLQHSVVGNLICVIILWNLYSKNCLNKVL